ncbi:pilus assembly protein TadG-related protein [Lentibacillus salinarum]|uniref:Pilus assembly protein TadG-related protein n=1 Tax=Lentibacillus salinarum TaxID=446820 RepID=A0ABW3ZZ94_9BACI
MVKNPKVSSEKGAVLPFFALTSVVMLLIILLIVDIGNVRIVQSDTYKAADAGALAGAAQSDYHEQVDFEEKTTREPVYKDVPVYNYDCEYNEQDEEICTRVSPYTERVFDHWDYTVHEPEESVVQEWVEIREDDAKDTANELFWENANQSTLTADGKEVTDVDPHLTDQDKIAVWADVNVDYMYFPSFAEGFYNADDVPNSVNVHKRAHGQAVEW